MRLFLILIAAAAQDFRAAITDRSSAVIGSEPAGPTH